MAYIPEEENNSDPFAINASRGGGTLGSGGGNVGSRGATSGSGTPYTSLQKYIGANQGAGEQIAGAIDKKLGEQYTGATNKADTERNSAIANINAQTRQGAGEGRGVGYVQQYGGANTIDIGGGLNAAQNINRNLQYLQNPNQISAAVGSTLGTSGGANTLNSLLLQGSNAYQGLGKSLSDKYGGLENYLRGAKGEVETAAGTKKKEIEKAVTGDEVKSYATKKANDEMNSLMDKAEAGDYTAFNKLQNMYMANASSKDALLTPETLGRYKRTWGKYGKAG